MREFWIDVKDYEGIYQVSNWGRVKSLERDVIDYINGKQRVKHYKEKILKPRLDGGSYLQVILWKNGVQEPKGIHVLVAEAFIENPNHYKHVHHKDRNQQNNRIENLEWINRDEHYAMHGAEKSKTVYQHTKDGLLVKVWESAYEVERVLGFNHCHICNCCNGKEKTYKGYIWSYSPL